MSFLLKRNPKAGTNQGRQVADKGEYNEMGKVVIGWVKIPAGKLEEQVWWVLQNFSGWGVRRAEQELQLQLQEAELNKFRIRKQITNSKTFSNLW